MTFKVAGFSTIRPAESFFVSLKMSKMATGLVATTRGSNYLVVAQDHPL